jgi:crotonobetainyl-CoA:carnitine CoA-transferase CaiB-like acyl-CoA transferase
VGGVLEGVKVLEVAEYGFVPSAAAVLADWGAAVIKVEHPRGDPLRGLVASGLIANTGDFDSIVEQVNRNKRGIALDVAASAGREVFERLVREADVFITSLLPSSRARLRIEPDDLHAINPRLVYARGHGYGTKGPDADRAGFDSVSFWGRGGVGHVLTQPGSPLVMQRAAMGDVTSGMFLAGGIAAALFRRERTGEGGTVDVSLLGSAAWVLAPDLVATSVLDRDPPHQQSGAVRSNPLVGAYRTADDRWLVLNMMESDRYWRPFCAALGRDDLVDRVSYADSRSRAANAAALHGLISDVLASRSLTHWRPRLDSHGCVWAAMAAPTEVLRDQQVEDNGFMPRHPDHTRARLAASPVQFDGEPVSIRNGAPALGGDTEAVLTELGYSEADIVKLREAGVVK